MRTTPYEEKRELVLAAECTSNDMLIHRLVAIYSMPARAIFTPVAHFPLTLLNTSAQETETYFACSESALSILLGFSMRRHCTKRERESRFGLNAIFTFLRIIF